MEHLRKIISSRQRPLRWAVAAAALMLSTSAGLASGPEPVQEILQRTGRLVEGFVDQISGVRCVEQVLQQKLKNNGKVEYKTESVFDSFVLVRVEGNGLTVDEARQIERQNGDAKNRPLMLTEGFSTLALVFHPYYQDSFEFSRHEDVTVEGKRLTQVQFRHIPGARSPAALERHGQDDPLELEGTAWVDSASGAIVKITAEVHGGLEDLGLRAIQSQVDYAPVTFAGATQVYWLPTSAVIDLESPRQHWRNIHRFTNYRRFSVAIRIGPKEQP